MLSHKRYARLSPRMVLPNEHAKETLAVEADGLSHELVEIHHRHPIGAFVGKNDLASVSIRTIYYTPCPQVEYERQVEQSTAIDERTWLRRRPLNGTCAIVNLAPRRSRHSAALSYSNQ